MLCANEGSTPIAAIGIVEKTSPFLAAVATTHTPAAQVVRQLVGKFIALHETPN